MATCKSREEVEKYAHVAGFEKIKGNGFNLNIPRYVDTFEEEEEEEIDIDAVQIEIDELEKELKKVRVKMTKKLKEIRR
jgi:type I restriction enzyme M protein